MGFNCGIVGLPNVGKSTIFNAMTAAHAAVSNYPFSTIDQNVGMVPLADERLLRLAGLVKPEKTTATSVEFVDIAGLVKGASKGEGLGNQFLGHIRSVDVVAHIVRCFEDPQVVHVDGRVDPLSDIEIVETELMLADLDAVERRLEKAKKFLKAGDKTTAGELGALEEAKGLLQEGRPARLLGDEKKGLLRASATNLLTMKPLIYVANVGEEEVTGLGPRASAVREMAEGEGAGFVTVSGKIEAEVAELPPEERVEFLKGLGLKESGLSRLAQTTYRLLGFITFFTVGKKEVRAWTVRQGTSAPVAGGVLHTDFEHGFIKAEVISYEDFIALGSEARCREKGLVRLEGKDYIVNDGDIIHFMFAV